MNNLTSNCVDQLNYRLDDLNINNTFRFNLKELEENTLNETIIITILTLIQKLRYYDESILPISRNSELHQIWIAIQSRHPPFHSSDNFSVFLILDFICTHLQAERMKQLSKGMQKNSSPNKGKIAFRLDKINRELNINSQSESESAIIRDITNHLQNLFSKTSRDVLLNQPKILAKYVPDLNSLTQKQYDLLQRVNSALIEDFLIRRRMLIKRLDVTIRSFLWGEKAIGREDEIITAIDEQRQYLTEQPTFYQIEDAINAPIGLLYEHSKKVTGSSSSTGSIVKKVLIGKVPDRGGRPLAEHRAKAIIAREGRGYGGGGSGNNGGGGRGGGGRFSKGRGDGGGHDHDKKRKEEGGGNDNNGNGGGNGGGNGNKKGRVVTHT